MSQIDFLQTMCNKYGDFKVAYSFKDKNGDFIWSKHRSVLECWHSKEGLCFLDNANHRNILPNEIVLDIDENPTIERFEDICDILKRNNIKFSGYSTGSRGYHIHCIFDELPFCKKEQRNEIRNYLIKLTKSCPTKITENTMIAMENCIHWKSGKKKTLLIKNG